jgi:hypothetical protein
VDKCQSQPGRAPTTDNSTRHTVNQNEALEEMGPSAAKENAPSGNRTRGISLATRYFTTKPTALARTPQTSPRNTTLHSRHHTPHAIQTHQRSIPSHPSPASDPYSRAYAENTVVRSRQSAFDAAGSIASPVTLSTCGQVPEPARPSADDGQQHKTHREPERSVGGDGSERSKRECAVRESNPGHLVGNEIFYH